MAIPVVLTIGALDPLGADGVAADLRACAALRVHGAAVIAALGIEPLPVAVLEDQLCAVLDEFDVAAIKTGALGSREAVEAVAAVLTGRALPLVIDPALAGRDGPPDGPPAAEPETIEAYRTCLLPLATVATSNMAEAALLTGTAPGGTLGEMLRQGEALTALGCAQAVVSGGHGRAAFSTDILAAQGAAPVEMRGERFDREGLRGLSATFSAAIAANIARGDAPIPAIQYAKLFVTAAIANAESYAPARGPRPVNAFHRMWLAAPASFAFPAAPED